jgi:hypothetical protein
MSRSATVRAKPYIIYKKVKGIMDLYFLEHLIIANNKTGVTRAGRITPMITNVFPEKRTRMEVRIIKHK